MQTAPDSSHIISSDSPPLAYPIETAMRGLAIGRTKLYQLIALGELDTYTVGKRRYISQNAIERFIARREAAERESRLSGGVR